jgi:hypothetical protein
MSLRPIGPDVPPQLRALLSELREAITELQEPTQPQPVYACATTDMPPAASFASRVLWNTTLNILAVSDGTDWRRQDTGAII